MDIITIDKLGRVVLPKALRDGLGLLPGSRMLALRLGDRLVLESVDAAAVARRLHEELKGIDIERIAREARGEADEVARREIAGILAGHEPVRGRGKTPAKGHAVPGSPAAAARARRRGTGGKPGAGP
ncbi:MAG: AbrB/MazE/SpoVT family DNA-binding domain-containing protein [Thermoplasmatota archaeon]